MFGKGTHDERDHKSAAEYRQTADEHVQTLKDFWKEFLVSGLFVLAALVIILACLAWFAANNKVNATGSSISAKADRYALVAAGSGKDGAHTGYYERTDAERAKLGDLDLKDSMTVTLNSNLNNDSAGSIYPGARGQVTFTVVPLVDNLNGVTISLSNVVQGAMDQGTSGSQIDATTAQTILALLRGHLLFFRGCDSRGFYSNRVVDDTFTIPASEFCEEGSTATTKSAEVTLYWVWPEFIQNLVYLGNANYFKNLFVPVSDTNPGPDYLSLQSYVNSAKTDFYFGASDGTPAASAPDLSLTMSSTNLATCAALYNNADELIGNNVRYLQLRIDAREGGQ